MIFAPSSQGAIVKRKLAPPSPRPETIEYWRKGAEIADVFWDGIEKSSLVSDDFRRIAGEARASIRAQYVIADRMIG
ncbi:MAG: hypothetical protein LBE50_01750 [Gallionellaceae bacterium]|jgi:hypothetical protein|nr:hypothetical protein [Gallionellaceae bacterium]